MLSKQLANLNEFNGMNIDDLVIHINSWEEHSSHIEKVLLRLNLAKITIKLLKNDFGCNELDY